MDIHMKGYSSDYLARASCIQCIVQHDAFFKSQVFSMQCKYKCIQKQENQSPPLISLSTFISLPRSLFFSTFSLRFRNIFCFLLLLNLSRMWDTSLGARLPYLLEWSVALVVGWLFVARVLSTLRKGILGNPRPQHVAPSHLCLPGCKAFYTFSHPATVDAD